MATLHTTGKTTTFPVWMIALTPATSILSARVSIPKMANVLIGALGPFLLLQKLDTHATGSKVEEPLHLPITTMEAVALMVLPHVIQFQGTVWLQGSALVGG